MRARSAFRHRRSGRYLPTPAMSPALRAYRPLMPDRIVRFLFYLFAVAIPFEVLDVGGSGWFSISKLAGLFFASGAVLLSSRIVLRKPPRAFWFFVSYVALMGVLGIVGEGVYLREAIRRLLQLGQMLILFDFAYQLFLNRALSQRVLLAFSLSAFALSGLGFLGGGFLTVRPWGETGRVSILSWALNPLGAILATAGVAFIGLSFGVGGRGKARPWVVAWVALVPVTFALARTGSRTAMLGLALGASVLLLQRARTFMHKARTVAATVVVMSVLFAIMAFTDTARERWVTTMEEHSMANRQAIFSASLAAFLKRPILGWGPGKNVEVVGKKVGRSFVDTHNSYLWVATETGLAGAIPFLAGLWLCFRSAWRARAGPRGVLPLALLVCILVINSAGTAINMKYTWLVLAYALASDPEALVGAAGMRWKDRVLRVAQSQSAAPLPRESPSGGLL